MDRRGRRKPDGDEATMAAYSDMNAPHSGRALDTGKLVNVAGGLVSLGLVIGIGVWGYKLVMRDVTGVPVVRAMEGAMRTAPSNPGGDIADHVGLSVNAVAAQGGAAAPEDAETLLLAPQMEALPAEDLAVMPTAEAGEVIPDGVDTRAPAPEADAVGVPSVAVTDLSASGIQPLSADDILAMADQLAAGATPMEAVDTSAVPPVETAINGVSSAVIADIIPASVPGVSRSPRPMARPEGLNPIAAALAAAAAAPVSAPRTVATDATVTTTAIPVGTNLVQLGAYDTVEIAAREWVRFNDRFPDFMADKDRVIQQAERGGRTFFRLRAMNFADLSDARRFCAALTAEGTDCVPVVVR